MTRKLGTLLLSGALVLTVLSAAGCAQREAVNYNNAMAEGTKKLENAGKKFGDAITPALRGGNANLAQVKGAYNGLLITVEEVKKDVAALKVPSSASAKGLADAFQRLLKGQEDMIKKDLGEIVRLLEDPAAQPGQRATRIQGILLRAQAAEMATVREVQDRQRAFAKEHNITLKPAP